MSSPTTSARLRMSRSALLAVGIFVICTIPLVSVSPWFLAVLALPVLAGVHVWRSGVDIGADGVTVRAAFRSVTVPWADVAGVEVRRQGELWLVRRNGASLRLPTLRVRDLHRLHEASGERLGLPADT
ncbi:MAG: PH domain-containing protein [Actinomycetota bacterium]|nr:PH domain-containing protein [Actinomycetota bacterium]